MIEIEGREYDWDKVEDALCDNGYGIDDLERGMIDEDELEEIFDWL